MELLDQLLNCNTQEFKKLKTKELESKRLTKLLGSKKKVMIKVRQIPYKRYSELTTSVINEKGNLSRRDTSSLPIRLVIEGTVSPDLKSKELMDHFGVATSEDLAEIIFQEEIRKISDEIDKLSVGEEEKTDEVKN